ncbi:hypothetical protein IAT38_001282 [Cryptococcus sp. DSM 104549]
MLIPMARSPSPADHPRETKKVKTDIERLASDPSPHIDGAGEDAHTVELDDEEALVTEQMALPIEFPKQYEQEINYREKLVLAPMVRTGTLPMRLLSLYYGAGLVWSPEVVDKAIIGAQRTVDPETGVITYHKGQGPIFSTHPIEKPYLIFQIGSSDPKLAVKAAQTVQQDVSGVDLNCGCPKPFSTHSGMGAALLSTPDLLLDILRALLSAIPLPISCKIRLLPTQPSTLYLASRILRTGIRNLTVHCRTRSMRPGERALWERLGNIVDMGRQRGVPVICNGDGDGWPNWERIRKETGADSVMLARAAERNPSVFTPTGPVCTVSQIYPKLLAVAEYTKNPWGNTKFLLNQFKPSPSPISTLTKAEKKEISELVSKSKSVEELSKALQLDLGRGKDMFDQISTKIRERETAESNVWVDRHMAEARGEVVDGPVMSVGDAEAGAEVDGFEVGVGEAQEQHT